MTDTSKTAETSPEPEPSKHERAYAVICLVSLLLVVVLLMLDGIGVWSVLPMLVGGVAFLLRWRSGPPLVLFIVLWMAPTQFPNGYEPAIFISAIKVWPDLSLRRIDPTVSLEDVILCAALLAYTAACYRSLALSHSILPPDYRRSRRPTRGPAKRPPAPQPGPLLPRPGEPASQWEVPVLFAALGASALGGLVLWALSGFVPGWLGLSPTVLRNAGYFWVCVLVVSLGLAFFRYQARRRAPPEENLLYLQDQLWRQTRTEQGVVDRWLVWARQRGQRRKEQ
jgi:hypothetical protein